MKITNYKAIGKKSLIAVFDLELASGLIVYNAKLLDGANGKWIGFPEREFTVGTEKKYGKIIGFSDRATSERFTAEVLKVLPEVLDGVVEDFQ